MNQCQSHNDRESGVALIITLAVMALALLMVLGFTVSMRTEQIAANNFSQVGYAKQLAHAGIDEALLLVRANTPAPDANNFWVSMPGRIVFTNRLTSARPKDLLYSTNSSGGILNLNYDSSIIASQGVGGSPYRSPVNREIQVHWITVGTNGQPASANNPMIGRYAYWVDDEATKLNINAGMQRGSSPSSLLGASTLDIDLVPLYNVTASTATNIRNYALATNYFTAEQWRFTSGVGAPTYRDNKGYITADSEAIGKTPWGARRFDLNSSFATWSSEVAQGGPSTLNNANLNSWFGHTFYGKYGEWATKQILANIADFRFRATAVGCTGSSDLDTGGAGFNGIPRYYLGQRLGPMLNEISLMPIYWRPAGGGEIQLKLWVLCELVNPYNSPWGNGWQIKVNMDKLSYRVSYGSSPQYHCGRDTGWTWNTGCPGWSSGYSSSQEVTTNLTSDIPARSYSVVAVPVFVGQIEGNPSALIDELYVRINKVRLLSGSSDDSIRDWAYFTDFDQYQSGGNHFTFFTTNYIQFVSSGGQPAFDNNKAKGIAKNDPRVRRFTSTGSPPRPAWYRVGYDTTTNATINAENVGVVNYTGGTGIANVPNDTPPTSMTGIGLTNHPSFYAKATTSDVNYESPGELGYVHTGLQWRTLMLQPRPVTEITANLIPDWTVLDLFATTNLGVQGRVNINAAVTNLYSGNANWRPRVMPLFGLLTAITAANGLGTNHTSSNFEQLNIATNIYNMTFVNMGSLSWGLKRTNAFNFLPGVYNMIGELCEVDRVATNWGASSNFTMAGYTNDFVREARIRSFANLVTTRTERWRVWAVGQAIQEPNVPGQIYGTFQPGIDLVLGEAKAEALLKRYQDPVNGIYGDGDDTVTYKTVYFRYLTEMGSD